MTVTLHWLNGSTYELNGLKHHGTDEIEDMPSLKGEAVANDGTAFLKTL